MINPVSNVSRVQKYYPVKSTAAGIAASENSQDVKIKENSKIKLSTSGNVTRVSFKGRMQDPFVPSIQMKVRGVTHHQSNGEKGRNYSQDNNIEKLADSNWYDGKKLDFKISESDDSKDIILYDPDFGEIGRVPDEIAPSLVKLLRKNENEFEFQLSNVIAGTSKSAPTIGLRVNLLYTGNNEKTKQKAERTFDFLLNSENKEIKESIMQYQPRMSPMEVLQKIFDIEKENNGPEAVKELETVIDAISDEIKDPKNKNILLLGHCLPDGDTIGCVLGMQAAIKSTYPEKNVQCSIDDKLPGLYRDNLPGIDNIKRPYNAESIKMLEQNISKLKSDPQTPSVKSQLSVYEKELKYLKRNEIYFDSEIKDGAEPQKYDLVILMDIPSPSRFSGVYKDYIENAGKVIYIDHHPYHYEDWNRAKYQTGIDMNKVKKDNLSLVVPAVPAATELVTAVADNAGLLKQTLSDEEYGKQFVAGIVTGTSTDTGSFARTSNLTPEDIKKPVRERPNFYPEGLAKWLIDKIGQSVDKKWIREHIVYDISDKTDANLAVSPRQKMIDYSLKSRKIYTNNGLGFVSISYDQMYDIWESARQHDEKVTFADIQNSLKYSEVMSSLRESPEKGAKNTGVQPYKSRYQNDKIAVLIVQDKEKGKIDENSQLASCNGIRMSFRSQEGTNYAEMLASLFSGGGHGNAAGGRIDIDGITPDSNIVLTIDGKKEHNPAKIYDALKYNFIIKNNSKLSDEMKAGIMHKFAPVIDSTGRPVQEVINGIVSRMRKEQQ